MRADDAYHNLVDQLEFTRKQWESEMEQSCDIFEQTEDERLVLFRNELWIHINHDSTTLFRQDEVSLHVYLAITVVACINIPQIISFMTSSFTLPRVMKRYVALWRGLMLGATFGSLLRRIKQGI